MTATDSWAWFDESHNLPVLAESEWQAGTPVRMIVTAVRSKVTVASIELASIGS